MSGPDSHDETLTLLADKDQNTMEEKQFVLGRCGQQRISHASGLPEHEDKANPDGEDAVHPSPEVFRGHSRG